MSENLEFKMSNVGVANFANIPAIGCDSHLEFEHFDSQSLSPRLIQSFLKLFQLTFLLLFLCQTSWAADAIEAVYIEAGEMMIDHQEKTAVFTGEVVLRRGTFTLNADQLFAYYEETDQGPALTQGKAKGSVRFVDGDREGRANELVFQQETGQVILMGDAEIIEPRGSLKGDSIIYDLNLKRTIVFGEQQRVTVRIDDDTELPVQQPDKPDSVSQDE